MVDQNYPNYKKVIFVFTIITETGSSGIWMYSMGPQQVMNLHTAFAQIATKS